MQIIAWIYIVPILYMNVILIIYLYNRKSYLLLYSRLKKLLLHQLETVEKHKHFNPFIMPPHRAVWCNSELQNAEERHQFFVLCYLWVSQWSLNNVGPISPAQAVLPCLQCGPLWSLYRTFQNNHKHIFYLFFNEQAHTNRHPRSLSWRAYCCWVNIMQRTGEIHWHTYQQPHPMAITESIDPLISYAFLVR